jgi:hypothetical protein
MLDNPVFPGAGHAGQDVVETRAGKILVAQSFHKTGALKDIGLGEPGEIDQVDAVMFSEGRKLLSQQFIGKSVLVGWLRKFRPRQERG